MGNSSYLCATDKKLTYPSFKDAEYNSAEQTIAMDVYAVPMLWLCLFKETDLISETIESEGYIYNLVSPLTKTNDALDNLRRSKEFHCELFKPENLTADYFELFEAAVSSCSKEFITAEIQEIACLDDESEFYENFRNAIRLIEDQNLNEITRQTIVKISDLRLGKTFPHPKLYSKEIPISKDEYWNQARILGASLFRKVPWE